MLERSLIALLSQRRSEAAFSRWLGYGLRDTQGVFAGRNITPDKETGIGSWTPEQLVAAIQTGQRPDGRTLAPIMPWPAFAHLTADDAMAIAAFLQSVKPISNKVPGRFKPGDTVSRSMMRIIPPGGTAATAPN